MWFRRIHLVSWFLIALIVVPAKALSLTDYKLVGQAKFKVLFWDIYRSELWTKTGKFDALNDDCIFVINYLRDIDADELLKRTIEQWQHLNVEAATYTPFVTELSKIWPDINAGDSLTMKVTNGKTDFYFNDKKLGGITNQAFAPLFLSIWLDKNTSHPDLRAQLLGNKL